MEPSKLVGTIVSTLLDNPDFELCKEDIHTIQGSFTIYIPKYKYDFSWDLAEDHWEEGQVAKRAARKLYLTREYQSKTRQKISLLQTELEDIKEKFILLSERVAALEYAPGGENYREAKTSFEKLSQNIE
ncbi:putative antitoxin [Brazilian marseillevirus]|uniref:putative antitoxin n=1 Tax=Brazilian marseillevirus TaxID=1813599 RepID=UPI0007818850|nr:putative antitoxin [Brazilian marseillevirus]AMQ10975.1 putative antitoxin [Brazilian marseillevirus]